MQRLKFAHYIPDWVKNAPVIENSMLELPLWVRVINESKQGEINQAYLDHKTRIDIFFKLTLEKHHKNFPEIKAFWQLIEKAFDVEKDHPKNIHKTDIRYKNIIEAITWLNFFILKIESDYIPCDESKPHTDCAANFYKLSVGRKQKISKQIDKTINQVRKTLDTLTPIGFDTPLRFKTKGRHTEKRIIDNLEYSMFVDKKPYEIPCFYIQPNDFFNATIDTLKDLKDQLNEYTTTPQVQRYKEKKFALDAHKQLSKLGFNSPRHGIPTIVGILTMLVFYPDRSKEINAETITDWINNPNLLKIEYATDH